MSSAELKQLLTNIETELGGVGDLVGAIDPALIPFIAIGKAVGNQVPGLVSGVADWIGGNPPSQQDIDDLHTKLSVLSDPNLP